MRSATTQFLTRREIVLLSAFLFALLYVSQNGLFAGQRLLVRNERPNRTTNNNRYFNEIEPKRYPNPTLTWKDSVPETKVVKHVPGWTIFDNLFVFEGTMYVVTSKPEDIPDRKYITSCGRAILSGNEEPMRRLPTDIDLRVVTPQEARDIFKSRSAINMDGVSFLNTDDIQFIKHYYHFTAELLFGFWRTYSSLDPLIGPDGRTVLSAPRRLIFRNVTYADWPDYASMNQYVLQGAFPGIAIQGSEDWISLAEMHVPTVFQRVVLADRAAATLGDLYQSVIRTPANAFMLPGSVHWWEPIRANVLSFGGLPSSWISGHDPFDRAQNERHVITYISRQNWGRRMLRPADHERLVAELYKLRDRYGYEVNVVNSEKLTRSEQIQIAGRTTIMLGVHGNGLTALVWMRPSPRATVIEFFYPNGFIFDYEHSARSLGMKHYGIWNNITVTQPDVPKMRVLPEGFHSNEIPVDGAVVARLVHKRLILAADDDDDDDDE